MKIIRAVLGAIILFLDWAFTPKGIKRDQSSQQAIDAQTANLSLYQFKACPFCVKVRRSAKRQSLNIETKNAKIEGPHRDELEKEGGRIKVPCLKIEENGETQWLYESKEIISYLENRFSPQTA